MTCRDTERLWDELLDARDEPRAGLEAELEAHAAACPACEAVAARYRALRRALRAWSPAPASPEFAARVIRAVESEADEVLPIRRVAIAPRAWLSAAAVLVASALALWMIPAGTVRQARLADAPTPPPAAADGLDLSVALADATAATLELARDASAPAGRLGRDVIASASLPKAPGTAVAPSPAPSPDVLRSFGDRVEAGVRPLSGPARHAFGFLIPDLDAGAPAAPPAPPRSGA